MKLKILVIGILFVLINSITYSQTNANSIQSGVTFQWSDNQTTYTQPATIESITVNGNVYFSFGAPTGYELTQLGPNGHATNNISKNGSYVETTSASASWNTTALDAFQSKNLNYYFEANGNGQNICDNYTAEEATTSQRFTLTYDGGIVASSSGVIAVTEQNANNCYHIEFFGIPEDGGPEQSLGETFVNNAGTQWGFGGTGSYGNIGTPGSLNPPPAGSDYWLSDRVVRNAGTLGIAVFYLDDIAPTGSLITKATLTASTVDNGDGKMFILTLPDNDGDGFSDVDDLDDDNDGIKDIDESNGLDASGDHDVDGLPNYKDSDFCTLNSEGICAILDFDSDGISNHFDLDSDNDGIMDVSESGGIDKISPASTFIKDGKADGKPGSTPTTLGIPSSALTGNIPLNSDGTGNYNFLDLDSDDDGIPDNIELQQTAIYKAPSGLGITITDLDQDGVDDNYGTDLRIVDTDWDGIFDYVDSDSDNDGIPDIQENGMSNILSGIDSDNDGLDDIFEGSNINDPLDVNDEINNPNSSILPDSDLDKSSGGDLDYRDLFDINPAYTSTLDFDGIDDYLYGDSLLDGAGELTMMSWIKIDSGNSTGSTTLMGEDDGCRLFVTECNKLMFGIRSSSGTTHLATGINVDFNEWHHIAGVFSSSTGELMVYVDGKLEGYVLEPSLVGRTVSPSSDWNGSFEVGRRSTDLSAREHFKGDIDEIRVFDTALSIDQVQQMVYQEITNDGGFVGGTVIPKPIEDRDTAQKVSWSSLLAYYSMTDIKNNTTADYSSNDYELTLMNINTLQDQTAPMPYETVADGDWSSESTWLYG
ncbi:LamG domain-containing protein, partial [Winogradskyella vincentii]